MTLARVLAQLKIMARRVASVREEDNLPMYLFLLRFVVALQRCCCVVARVCTLLHALHSATACSGATAGCLASFFTNPLDLAKLRLQVRCGRGCQCSRAMCAAAFHFSYLCWLRCNVEPRPQERRPPRQRLDTETSCTACGRSRGTQLLLSTLQCACPCPLKPREGCVCVVAWQEGGCTQLVQGGRRAHGVPCANDGDIHHAL
jgi:hypothetical protein